VYGLAIAIVIILVAALLLLVRGWPATARRLSPARGGR
jgi:hypothetical protein